LQHQALRQRQIVRAAQRQHGSTAGGKNPRKNLEIHGTSLIPGKYSTAAAEKQGTPG